MSVDPKAFKDVLSRFASGVTIVTTSFEGAPYGLTVSAFCSVSVAPPYVLVCLGNDTDSKPMLERAGHFAVHILGREHAELGVRFAKMASDASDPFVGLALRTERTGSPILRQCLAWLDCRTYSLLPLGDHTVFVGEVEAAGCEPGEGEPVLYYRRAWHALDRQAFEP